MASSGMTGRSNSNQSDSRREARDVGKHCSTFESSSAGHLRKAVNIDWLEKTMTQLRWVDGELSESEGASRRLICQ